MSSPGTGYDAIRATKVYEPFVLAKCDFFSAAQIWPLDSKINPIRWLSNFKADEKEHAVQLLHAFLYFPQLLLDQLFFAAIQRLSLMTREAGKPLSDARSRWKSFLASSVFTRVTGEIPSDADSSFRFSRMTRQVLGINESQILSPEDALAKLMVAAPPRNLIFVDDFVGSGNQFIETWERPLSIGEHYSSFADVAFRRAGHRYLYCPLFCTAYGLGEINRKCSNIDVRPAHLITPQYSAVAADSILWPPELLPTARTFIEVASLRAGITPGSWKGFHSLGLALAFEHSVPDATLPLFYWNKNGWKPLIEKT